MNTNALRTSGHSGLIISDLFNLHLAKPGRPAVTVLDLTYGRGTFWKWEWDEHVSHLTANDLHVSVKESGAMTATQKDFNCTNFREDEFDVVVFDPPFTANGPSKDGHQKRYGADRSLPGAPQSVGAVAQMLDFGLFEAMRLARYAVICKSQDVTESGRVGWHTDRAAELLSTKPWYIEDKVWLKAARRPQPDKARGTSPKRMRERPSVFILAKKKGVKL